MRVRRCCHWRRWHWRGLWKWWRCIQVGRRRRGCRRSRRQLWEIWFSCVALREDGVRKIRPRVLPSGSFGGSGVVGRRRCERRELSSSAFPEPGLWRTWLGFPCEWNRSRCPPVVVFERVGPGDQLLQGFEGLWRTVRASSWHFLLSATPGSWWTGQDRKETCWVLAQIPSWASVPNMRVWAGLGSLNRFSTLYFQASIFALPHQNKTIKKLHFTLSNIYTLKFLN